MDLLKQYLSCTFPTFEQAQQLLSAGISARTMLNWHSEYVFDKDHPLINTLVSEQMFLIGCIRCAPIRVFKDIFEFDSDGTMAFITPVHGWADGDIESCEPERDAATLDILDLVAWHPDAPSQWALLRGAVTVLGLIEPQMMDPFPVRVHRGVLSWFRADRSGIVMLTNDPSEQKDIISQINTVAAEDRTHAAELIDLASRPVRIPSIIVASRKGAARAWQ